MSDLEIWVDFNEMDDSGYVITLVEYAQSQPFVGQSMVAGDNAGHSSKATVVEVDGELVKLSVNRSTYRNTVGHDS